jgi:hypothetical protein
MSHPVDRRHRFLIGKHKGERRVPVWINSYIPGEGMKQDPEARERWCRHRRDTTKLCSCDMCGNPRRVAWKDRLTMREKRFKDWKDYER